MKFSQIEKQDLLKAWIAVSFAFAVLNSNILSLTFVIFLVISMFTVGLGMLLHEIAHKYVAQKYGCWAEFRADDKMLIIAVITAFIGFLFIAPGAVWISGHVTKERNGKISLAGPLTNIILSLLFLIILFFPISDIFTNIAGFGFHINAWLALFNMIPFLNFDGAKVLAWNKIIYFITMVFAAILVFIPNLLQAVNV
jgi:Zn-dependent protease